MHTLSLLLTLFACSGDDAPPPPVAIATEAEETTGPASIEDVLEENKALIEQCFKNELREHPKLTGRMELEWKIDNHRVVEGQVVSANFPEDFESEHLATCVIEGSKSWRFPAGSGSVRYPITFTPQS